MTRPREASVGAWGLALLLFVTVLWARPAAADPADEAMLFARLASARAQAHLPALARSSELDGIARRHAARLAGAPQPFHNPGLRAETAGWLAVGEVVGRITVGPDWDGRLQQLFLSSPVHRRVILSSAYTVVGIGAVRTADGTLNAVEVFGRPSGAARPPRPPRAARAAVPVTAPPAPATTVPPTTTTTARSRLALAPLPTAPPASLPRPVLSTRSDAAPGSPRAVAAASELAAAVLLVSATRSKRGGRRRPGC